MTHDGDSIAATVAAIGEWSDAAFGARNGFELGMRAQAIKLVGEVVELAAACGCTFEEIYRSAREAIGRLPLENNSVPDWSAFPAEAADVAIVLCVLAHRAGIDLGAEIAAKHRRNLARTWSVTPDGAAQHVASPGEARP
jgi:NTP pyrophosphatase (non-canonical NTP hydrolase)